MPKRNYSNVSSTAVTTTRKLSQKKSNPRKYRRPTLKDIVDLGVGMPIRARCTHKYCENVTLTSSIGAYNTYVFSTNSLYDPNLTGVGHQPLYFDQIGLFYNRSCVTDAKITVKFTTDTTNSNPLVVVLFIDDDATTTVANIQTLAENSTANSAQLKVIKGGSEAQQLSKSWSLKQAFGPTNISDAQYSGTSSSGPADQQYFIIGMQPMTGSTTSAVLLQVQIEYTAIWWDMKEVSGS